MACRDLLQGLFVLVLKTRSVCVSGSTSGGWLKRKIFICELSDGYTRDSSVKWTNTCVVKAKRNIKNCRKCFIVYQCGCYDSFVLV